MVFVDIPFTNSLNMLDSASAILGSQVKSIAMLGSPSSQWKDISREEFRSPYAYSIPIHSHQDKQANKTQLNKKCVM